MSVPANIDAALEFLDGAFAGVSLSADGEFYNAVPVQTGNRSDRFYISSSRRTGLVALLQLDDPDLTSFHVSSVIVASRCVLQSQPGDEFESYMRITCLDSNLEAAFRKFLEDIRLRLEPSDSTAASAVNEVVNEWRQLIAVVKDPLSRNELVGIFGELAVLERLVNSHGAVALEWWYGPDRTRHDFVGPSLSLEVKSTTDLGSNRVTIHGLGQLDHAEGTSSYIGLVGVDPTPRGRCIDDVSRNLKDLGCSVPLLEKKLLSSGYVAGNQVNSNERFVVAHMRFWQFDENSPGLRASNLRSDQQAGVSDVRFNFDLSALGAPLPNDDAAKVLSSFGGGRGT